jgi:polar amino acid transport system permease protein
MTEAKRFQKIKDDPITVEETPGTKSVMRRLYERAFKVPWWGVFLLIVGVMVYFAIFADPLWNRIFQRLTGGISLTLRVAFFSYIFAIIVGLALGLIRSSPPKPADTPLGMVFSLIRLAIYQVSSVIVEVLRGLPLATVLVVMAFVLIPQIVNAIEAANNIEISWRGGSVETAIVCLALVYGSFMSETFRAGIQSVEKGQLEAARALGLGYPKMMRYIVLPQAIRRILPPLGNDFVSMIKDSALVSLIGLRDITQVAKIDSGSTFQYLPTYLTVAVLYLSLTIVGSLGVKYIERRFKSSVR